jgi:hypothetical protein
VSAPFVVGSRPTKLAELVVALETVSLDRCQFEVDEHARRSRAKCLPAALVLYRDAGEQEQKGILVLGQQTDA